MPKAEEFQVIVEWTHNTLHALRAVNGTIEAGGECVLDNKPAFEALVGAVAPAWKTEGIKVAAVWPDAVEWRLSNDTEAAKDRSTETLQAIAAATLHAPKGPFAFAACDACDGGPIAPDGSGKWLLACASGKSLERVSGSAPGFPVNWGGAIPAAFARIGAVSGALRAAGKGSVALWDVGARQSHLLLVTADGVEAVAPCAVGLDAIYEAVQAALKLKFRGAGARLFFSDGYDFTDSGPQICAIVGAELKHALSHLPARESPPALACIGLTGRQAWFIRDTAVAAGTSPWVPDLAKLAGNLGPGFKDAAVGAPFSPACVGILEILGSRLRGGDAWLPEWSEGDATAQETAEAPVPTDEVYPIAPEAPQPSRSRAALVPEGGQAPPPPSQRTPKAARPADVPAPQAPARQSASPFSSAKPPAPPTGAPLSFPPPAFVRPPELGAAPAIPAAPAAASPASGPGPQSVPPAGVAVPKLSLTGLPFEAGRLKPGDAARPKPESPVVAVTKSKLGLYVGIIAAAALAFAAIAVVLDARMQRIKEHDLEEQEALAHHLAEVRTKDAGQIAKAADQARKDALAAAAAAQKKTPDIPPPPVSLQPEAAKTARLPGTLLVATDPTGAAVSIDGATPLTTPARMEGIAAGAHRVRIALSGYQFVELDAQVKGSATTDLGTIKLESSLGTLDVASSPDALEFAIRPGTDPLGKPVWTGRTPATLAGVPRGDYVVTFSRPGFHDHTEKVSVEKEATFLVSTRYLNGSLELTSDPTGAWVDRDGAHLGTTPLVLHDLAPRPVSFEITLPGYDPMPISGEVPEGQTLKLNARLLRKDRIFTPGEAKSLPVSYEAPPPELSLSERRMDAEVTVSLVVQRDGTVVDVQVEKTTDDDIGRRCAAAVAKWKFRPGTAADDRTVDVRIEMPFKFSAGN